MKTGTLIIGNEYDNDLKAALSQALKSMGAKKIDGGSLLAGSQEIHSERFEISDCIVEVESETYIGLSLIGPIDLIEKIKIKTESFLR